MGLIPLSKFSLNSFYEKTPTALKYILVISLIAVGSYFLFSKKATTEQDRQIAKIEKTIETTYMLIDRFDQFETAQYSYNKETMRYLKNIFTLVEELNENTNKKFDILMKQGGSNADQILSQLTMLNESYEKLTKAYRPDPFEQNFIADPRNSDDINNVVKTYEIAVKKKNE